MDYGIHYQPKETTNMTSRLNVIFIEQQKLERDIGIFIDEYVKPRLASCKTESQAEALRSELQREAKEITGKWTKLPEAIETVIAQRISELYEEEVQASRQDNSRSVLLSAMR